MSSLDDGKHDGPETSVSYPWVGALGPPQTSANNHNPILCLYDLGDGNECLDFITCGTAPGHFSAVHGVKGMARNVEITCGWQDCGSLVKRHNFMRHVREIHLGHGRRANQN
ncbi:hypothetical protein F5J12DRAFT_787655 [Pisolithus orientalis]|uniref:uncharacterized protein n=1 Tax=Pisolithus orientalis TaxID=936130 RepID=UPI0022240975|nr:uncharacterized protein F5J12DRAFT_787655 [Pisolithus orientalis]KAI5984124.1 hypothetical protein F5J12DRAFT_787655 [Pisolithus orientalis]